MSEVNLQFTVNTYSANITTTTNPIIVKPLATQLTMSAGFAALPTTLNTQVTFNDAGVYGGNNSFVFDKTNNRLTVTNANITNANITSVTISNVTTSNITVSDTVTAGNLSVGGITNLGPINNVIITGGLGGQVLQTNGLGTLSFGTITVPVPGGSNTQLQYNSNGAFAGIPGVTYSSGNLAVGAAANLKLLGGTNGQYLQTDGAGNLAWSSGGGNGNGTVGGSNTQVQFNNAGLFGGTTTFTFNNATNTLSVTNIVASGAGLTNIPAANLSGIVPNANFASYATNATISNTAITVTANAQPNITSHGILTSLSVAGTTILQQAKEKVNIVATAFTGNIAFDVLTSAINYYTATQTGNVILNIRGNSTTTFNNTSNVGDSVTITAIATVGATAYIIPTLQVDGSNVTPKWLGNSAPSTTAISVSALNAYTYTLIKTAANTYSVLASYTGYK